MGAHLAMGARAGYPLAQQAEGCVELIALLPNLPTRREPFGRVKLGGHAASVGSRLERFPALARTNTPPGPTATAFFPAR